jgi:Holliday junction DNA helicase RuvA
MICQIKGKLVKKEENRLVIEVQGLSYEVQIPKTVSRCINKNREDTLELVIYHYFNLDKNKGAPVMVGFLEELEKDFFEKFISVSGVGPKAALRAFDKPVAVIARAIENADLEFLKTLAGVGKQRAKQIVAHLQGKVGRFALIKEEEPGAQPVKKEVVEEAKEVLKRLQYTPKEAEAMIRGALAGNSEIDRVEELLNEIYRQRR